MSEKDVKSKKGISAVFKKFKFVTKKIEIAIKGQRTRLDNVNLNLPMSQIISYIAVLSILKIEKTPQNRASLRFTTYKSTFQRPCKLQYS